MKVKFFAILLLIVLLVGPVLADQPNSQYERAQLQQQLAEIQAQISEYEKQLAVTKTQSNTLANKINQLKKQQATLELQIRATNLQIDDINNQVVAVQTAIDNNNKQLIKISGQISFLLNSLWQKEQDPWWYRLLGNDSIDDVFKTLQDYYQIVSGLRDLSSQARDLNVQLEQQQIDLQQQQESMNNLLAVKILQQNQLLDSVQTQRVLLNQTKGKEAAYQQSVSNAKKQAAEIQGRIYQLLDVSTQITFGQALEIANWVSGVTGVRAAFLLAVLSQESNLGRNVGTCNRLGDPPSKSWKVIMKPSRDQEPFLAITKSLGMDPDVTPVSCPMFKNGEQLGWGGAMGPAQFIPSTWMGYKDKVSNLTGSRPANPWDIRDAFAASAIKLSHDGAADGTRQGEWNAAMRYFSGSTNPAYSFYGDSVMAKADGYQDDIDQVNNN
ncbi:MAG: hypothetical protein JW816_00740 [Candidatus Buchananbacteria bacterium]|nr:hypothetical protein [Candidatus Buchananbacteria bacterium]